MYSNLNPRTMGLNKYSFDELLPVAAKYGFEGIEVPAGAFETVEKAREAGYRLAGLGMKWGLIMAPCDLYKVDDAAFAAGLKTFAEWAKCARAAGCTRAYNHIWPGSNERDYEQNFAWHVARLRAINNVLSDSGIRYGLEFMGPRTVRDNFRHEFVHSLSGTLALAAAVDKRIGFVFDTIHWYGSGSRMDDLYFAASNTDLIINLHLNDANPKFTRETQLDAERGLPMEHGIVDAVHVLKLLNRGGYDGPVIIEPMKPATEMYEKMPLEEAVASASACLHGVLRQAGVRP